MVLAGFHQLKLDALCTVMPADSGKERKSASSAACLDILYPQLCRLRAQLEEGPGYKIIRPIFAVHYA
jgi:hypothetical protein